MAAAARAARSPVTTSACPAARSASAAATAPAAAPGTAARHPYGWSGRPRSRVRPPGTTGWAHGALRGRSRRSAPTWSRPPSRRPRQALAPLGGRVPGPASASFVSGGSTADWRGAVGRAGRRQLWPRAAMRRLQRRRRHRRRPRASRAGARSASGPRVLPGVRLRTFHLEVMRADARHGRRRAAGARRDDVAVLLADPYSFPADGFVSQANARCPACPSSAGWPPAPRGAGSTRLLVDGRTVDRGAVGVLLRRRGRAAPWSARAAGRSARR